MKPYNKIYDVIILGAGLTGISLALEILSRTNLSVLIVEKKKKFVKDKNWCFWNKPKNYFTSLSDFSWNEIIINIDKLKLKKRDSSIQYLCISSLSYYKQGLKKIQTFKNARVELNNKVKNFYEQNGTVFVETKKSIYQSKLLFNSIPSPVDKDKLKQHFLGVEINCNKNVFNDKQVTLMDFSSNKKTVHFFYILPFTKKKALIETTYFSNKIYKKEKYIIDIKNYLKKNYPKEKFRISYSEHGVLPMYHNNNKQLSKKIFNIGITNNWIKMSTGYCLQNAFEKSVQIVNCIIKRKTIIIKSKRLNKFLDEIFCEFISRYPEDVKLFFVSFYSKLSLKIIVRFLTEKNNLFELLKVLTVLPKKKLFFSLFHKFKIKV